VLDSLKKLESVVLSRRQKREEGKKNRGGWSRNSRERRKKGKGSKRDRDKPRKNEDVKISKIEG